jgi:hypothetical protein
MLTILFQEHQNYEKKVRTDLISNGVERLRRGMAEDTTKRDNIRSD